MEGRDRWRIREQNQHRLYSWLARGLGLLLSSQLSTNGIGMLKFPVKLTIRTRRPLGKIEQIWVANTMTHFRAAIWTDHSFDVEIADFLWSALEPTAWASYHFNRVFVCELSLAGRTSDLRSRSIRPSNSATIECATRVRHRKRQRMWPVRLPRGIENESDGRQ